MMSNLLIWLVILWSGGHCRRASNTSELSCNITTPISNKNGTTSNSTRPISAVNRCPASYKNEEIIKKCEYLVDPKMPNNRALYKPVTNSWKNITYWNEYCAACNYETNSDLEFWPSWQNQNIQIVCFIHESAVKMGPAAAATDIEFNRDYFKEHIRLKSSLDKSASRLQCSIEERWPLNLVNFVAPCMANSFRDGLSMQLKSCQYIKSNAKVCLEMRFLIEGLDFVYDTNDRIDLIRNSSAINFRINDEYIAHQTGVNSVIFVCEPDEKTYKLRYWYKIACMIASVIFISIYLAVNFGKKYFQSFPNKILFSYSIGLLIMYLFLVLVYLFFFETCIAFFLVQFSWFFHFFWTMLLSLEFCRLTYCTLRKRLVSSNAQHKRFLVYCFVGFVLPAVLPVIYFSLLMLDNPCPSVPGYFSVPCRATQDSMANYILNRAVEVYHRSFSFVIPVVFLLQAFILIYMTKCGPNRIRSTANRSEFVILIKMAYIMGIHWMLYEICVRLGYNYSPIIPYLSEVFEYSADLQGVFVFFVFSFKRRMLTRAWEMCSGGCRTIEPVQSGTDVTEMSLSRSQREEKTSMMKT